MTTHTHTAGEWKVIPILDKTNSHTYAVATEENGFICQMFRHWSSYSFSPNEQTLYNALLVSAAPLLLGACELALDLITGQIKGTDPENTIVLPALRAAIARAKGS